MPEESLNYVQSGIQIIDCIAGVLLLAGLYFAYRQIVIATQDINLRNQRASAEKAIDVCDEYFNVFIPLENISHEEQIKNNATKYNGKIGDFYRDSIADPELGAAVKRFRLKSWLMMMNKLESIAASYVAGVADESVGFKVMGRGFCFVVECYYDVISFGRTEKTNPYWSNIVELYNLWRPRLTKAEIEASIIEMRDKSRTIPEKHIPPIGSEA